MARAKFLILALLTLTVLSLTPKVYAVSDIPYNHPVNMADTCAPTGSETWGLVGSSNDTFNYGFGAINKVIGEFSSDFTGASLTSISFYLCGYKNDTIADGNKVKIGIYNQADGSLRQLLGQVPFDSLPKCRLNQDSSNNNCNLVNPAAITVTGNYKMIDAHSPGGTDYIGISFPTDSAKGHDVLAFCANNCSNAVVIHGGICDPYSTFNQCGTVGNVNVPGSAMAGTLVFTTMSIANSNFAAAINQASLFVGLVLILLLVYYIRSDKSDTVNNFILSGVLAMAIFFIILQAIGALIS